jgi:hypothetical protein
MRDIEKERIVREMERGRRYSDRRWQKVERNCSKAEIEKKPVNDTERQIEWVAEIRVGGICSLTTTCILRRVED